jgi:hypothetical protein
MDRTTSRRFSAIFGLGVCLGIGSVLSAAPAESKSAPAAAPAAAPAPAAAAPAARPAESAPARTDEAAANTGAANSNTTNSRPSNANVGNSPSDDHRIQPDHGHDGQNRPGYTGTSYPWIGYNYWGNGYDGYNYYNGPQYPGQFQQQDTAVAEPDSQSSSIQTVPTAPVPPSEPDTDSAVLKSALFASPQWRVADEQVRIAQSEYDSASAVVLAQLRAKPDYQQAVAQKAADGKKVASLTAKEPGAPIEQKEAIATKKLDAAQTVTQMETAALAADPRASAAKGKLDAAIAQRTETRQAIEAGIARSAPTPAR